MRKFFWLTLTSAAMLPACSSDSSGGASPPKAKDVAVNEMNAAGDEWLELYNVSGSDFDLGRYGLTDSDKDTGVARVANALRFPAGTRIPKRGFVLVLLGKKNSTPGPYSPDACLPGVPVGCFYGDFSISEARGEAVHLLAPDDAVASDTIYPANLDFDAGSDLTACRIPDGTGDLTACRATPGARNAAR